MLKVPIRSLSPVAKPRKQKSRMTSKTHPLGKKEQKNTNGGLPGFYIFTSTHGMTHAADFFFRKIHAGDF
jgi:hypothetical protein